MLCLEKVYTGRLIRPALDVVVWKCSWWGYSAAYKMLLSKLMSLTSSCLKKVNYPHASSIGGHCSAYVDEEQIFDRSDRSSVYPHLII